MACSSHEKLSWIKKPVPPKRSGKLLATAPFYWACQALPKTYDLRVLLQRRPRSATAHYFAKKTTIALVVELPVWTLSILQLNNYLVPVFQFSQSLDCASRSVISALSHPGILTPGHRSGQLGSCTWIPEATNSIGGFRKQRSLQKEPRRLPFTQLLLFGLYYMQIRPSRPEY